MTEQTSDSGDDLNLGGTQQTDPKASANGDGTGTQEPGNTQQGADLAFLDENASPEDKAKAEQRAKTKDGQVNAAREAVKAGKNLKSYPEYVQEALKAEGFGHHQEVKQVTESELVEKTVLAMEQKRGFDALKEQIRGLNLTPEKTAELETEYKSLRSEGLDPAKALPTAIRLTSVSQDVIEAEKRGIKFGRMGLAPQGKIPVISKQEVDPIEMEDDKFLEWADGLQSGAKINKPTP